jgi:WD domain, G-beta repeat
MLKSPLAMLSLVVALVLSSRVPAQEIILKQAVLGLAVSPDGEALITSSRGGGLRDETGFLGEGGVVTFWHMGTWKQRGVIKLSVDPTSLAIARDGKRLAVSGTLPHLAMDSMPPMAIEMSELSNEIARITPTRIGPPNFAGTLAFAPDGKTLAVAGQLLDIRTSKVTRLSQDAIFTQAFSPDGKILATGGWQQVDPGNNKPILRLWDPATARELARLEHKHWAVWSVAFSPDGKLLAAAGGGGVGAQAELKVWDVQTRRLQYSLEGHATLVNSVAFSPDGTKLASAGHDHIVKLWDMQTGKEIATFKGHSGPVHAVVFAPDGSALFSASKDDTVRSWSVNKK